MRHRITVRETVEDLALTRHRIVAPGSTPGAPGPPGADGSSTPASTTAAGVVELATEVEAVAGVDTARAVTPAGVAAAIAALVDAAPGTLDTLNELAAALGDDPNFATTVTTLIAAKAPKTPSFLTLGTDADLTNERVLTAGTGITLTDDGAGSTVTIAASGGAVPPIMPLSGLYRPASLHLGAASAAAMSLNACYFLPFLLPRSGTFEGVAEVITTANASSLLRMGVFSINDGLDPANGVTLVVDVGTASTASTGTKLAEASSAQQQPGWYLVAAYCGGSATHSAWGTFGSTANIYNAEPKFAGFSDPTLATLRSVLGWAKYAVNYDAGFPAAIAGLAMVSSSIGWVPYLAARVDYA